MRGWCKLIIIPLAALLAILPLILIGPSCGHDFAFHVHNWLEVSSQWKQRAFFPHWDFTAAWNTGEPRFVFYPPLSWAIGAVLGLLLPWSAVPTTFIWLALAACGFTMYRLAREWTSSGNALISAAFYMVHPYMLFTFYERAAYAELLAAAWIPLVFLAVLRPRLTVPSIALSVAALWITNAPAAVMGCYALAFLSIVRVIFTFRSNGSKAALSEAVKISAGVLLGIGLAASYVVPAALEQHWVQIRMPFLKGVRFQDNFLFGHIGTRSHVAILRTVSFCAAGLAALSVAFTVAALRVSRDPSLAPEERSARKRAVFEVALLACVIFFLLTSPSAALWYHLPKLRFLQFPWRFCAILGAAAAALLALAMPRTNRHPAVAPAIALALTLGVTSAGNYFFRQFCHTYDTVPSQVAHFYTGGGYDPTDEYTPIGSDPLAIRHANPAWWVAANPQGDAPPNAAANYSILLARRLHFRVSASVPGFLILRLRNYPAWKITINGAPVTSHPHRKDGLIALPIAAGISRIDVSYTHTADQTAGWVITAISAFALLLFSRKPRQEPLRTVEGEDTKDVA